MSESEGSGGAIVVWCDRIDCATPPRTHLPTHLALLLTHEDGLKDLKVQVYTEVDRAHAVLLLHSHSHFRALA